MEESPAHRRSKQPRSIIAGPYGHPFHPIAVTVPIGAWTAAIVFDIVGYFSADPAAFATGAMWLVGIGIVGALLAALFGLLDFSMLASGTPARATAATHMILNLVAIALFAVSFVLRLNSAPGELNTAAFIVSVIGYLLVGASGYLGGKLAYHYGVRVASERTQTEGF
ncbi:hypothetical protein GCM10027416_22390 [Okibacterium endophyticum]